MPKVIDLKGQRFGRLTVIESCGKASDRHILWLCKCDCGNERVISGNSLRSSLTKSCGCFNSDIVTKRNIKHNGCGTRLYAIWKNMNTRCKNTNNPRFKDYGGRGIKICSEWKEFINFRIWAMSNEYSKNLTIDRVNVNGNYEPLNCRWATYKEQNNNKRNSRGKIEREVKIIGEN